MKKQVKQNSKERGIKVVLSENQGERSTRPVERSICQVERSTRLVERSTHQVERSIRQVERSTHQVERSIRQVERSTHQGERSFRNFGLGSRSPIGPIVLMSGASGKNFIPGGNPLFDAWQKNLVIKVNGYISGWAINTEGLAEWASLTGTGNMKQIRWDAAWAKVSSKQFTHSEDEEMVAARKAYESGDKANPDDTSLRIWITRYMRNNKKVTNKQKSDCGLTVPKDGATATNPETVKAMEEAEMVISVKESKHLLHVCKITQDKKSVAMGKDVLEISVYIAFTAADVRIAPDLKDFSYDGSAKRGLYPRAFDAADEGKRAWYITRKKYKGKTKKLGTPSVAATAIII